MVKFIERVEVYIKNQLPKQIFLFIYKTAEVLISSLALLLLFGLLNYDYTIKNYISCIALYFIIEEIKPFILKNRGNIK
jgi:hypothetical protein